MILLDLIFTFLPIIFDLVLIYYIVFFIKKVIQKANTQTFFRNNVVYTERISNLRKNKYVDISTKQLKEFNTEDLDAFKNYFYKMFVDFEKAYNNLDYDMMSALCSKQFYQNYYTGITLDLESGNKKIISDIARRNVIIYEVFSSTTKQVVSAMIEVSYYNYTINKNGIIIKGSRENKVTEKFEVTFRKDFERKDVVTCKNCGATVSTGKCDYCGTPVGNVNFKIYNIQRIIEK